MQEQMYKIRVTNPESDWETRNGPSWMHRVIRQWEITGPFSSRLCKCCCGRLYTRPQTALRLMSLTSLTRLLSSTSSAAAGDAAAAADELQHWQRHWGVRQFTCLRADSSSTFSCGRVMIKALYITAAAANTSQPLTCSVTGLHTALASRFTASLFHPAWPASSRHICQVFVDLCYGQSESIRDTCDLCDDVGLFSFCSMCVKT